MSYKKNVQHNATINSRILHKQSKITRGERKWRCMVSRLTNTYEIHLYWSCTQIKMPATSLLIKKLLMKKLLVINYAWFSDIEHRQTNPPHTGGLKHIVLQHSDHHWYAKNESKISVFLANKTIIIYVDCAEIVPYFF